MAIGLVDYAFPVYLASISTIARFGTTFVFVLIVLIWFYALAIIILGGATINAMRFEIHDTGDLSTGAVRYKLSSGVVNTDLEIGYARAHGSAQADSSVLPDRRRAPGGAPGGQGAARVDLAGRAGHRRGEPRAARLARDQRLSSTW